MVIKLPLKFEVRNKSFVISSGKGNLQVVTNIDLNPQILFCVEFLFYYKKYYKKFNQF